MRKATWSRSAGSSAFARSSALATVAALALLAPPAHAGDVTHVALGSYLEDLIAGPDGGAWVEIARPRATEIGRATADGRFVTARHAGGLSIAGALGPDGQAWYHLGRGGFVRSDLSGALSRVRLPSGAALVQAAVAAGPDGTLWSFAEQGKRIVHLTPAGAISSTRSGIPECGKTEFAASGSSSVSELALAADGAMWVADAGCSRLLRITAAGTTSAVVKLPSPGALAADASGGMWFAGEQPGHVDAAGAFRRFDIGGNAQDVAVAPDGSAWFALGTCKLVRVSSGGEITTAPAPIPTRQLGFDPAGGMWLASRARLVHLASGEGFGACDGRPPTVRVRSGERSVTLRSLRRAGGVELVVREPVTALASGVYGDDTYQQDVKLPVTTLTKPKGGIVRLRVTAAQRRRFERALTKGTRPELQLLVFVMDREGNTTFKVIALRVKR